MKPVVISWSSFVRLVCAMLAAIATALITGGCASLTTAQSGSVASPEERLRQTMSPPEARRAIQELLQVARAGGYGVLKEIEVDEKGFSYVESYESKLTPRRTIRFDTLGYVRDDFSFNLGYRYVRFSTRTDDLLYWPEPADAKRFASAINAIVYHKSQDALRDDEQAFEAFQARAREWLAQPGKPDITEDIRRYKAMAEDAFRNKEFEQAINSYEEGLDVYPFWAEGHFNAALLCAEVEMYGRAVAHMKRYLTLAPNAPDAKAAQDKLYVWEGKLRRPASTGMNHSRADGAKQY